MEKGNSVLIPQMVGEIVKVNKTTVQVKVNGESVIVPKESIEKTWKTVREDMLIEIDNKRYIIIMVYDEPDHDDNIAEMKNNEGDIYYLDIREKFTVIRENIWE